jgi:cellulose synthase/poly-beta-1,6-N-acetylglucosamine synthase-like glycosyltransferase
MSILFLTLYSLLVGALFLLALHRLLTLVRFFRIRGRNLKHSSGMVRHPFVTLQLPVFNEPAVIGRLLSACREIAYPRDRFEIQILDDSTDVTSELVRSAVAEIAKQGIAISHIHRKSRCGFKAGALRDGLSAAKGELIAIFDADFVPRPDFLEKTVPYFNTDDVGMVQVSWGYLNDTQNLLTKGEAALLDGHFAIEHPTRFGSGLFFNFNGSGGIWSRSALLAAGGWECDTVTEDLDLSYRALLHGVKFVYLADERAPSELPSDVSSFRLQQHRWAMGGTQVFRKLAGRLLAADLPWRVKLEGVVHLGGNVAYPLLVATALGGVVYPFVAKGKMDGMLSYSFLFGFFISLIFHGTAVRMSRGLPVMSCIAQGFLGILVGLGLSLSNSIAFWEGLCFADQPFHRTPKSGNRENHFESSFRPIVHLFDFGLAMVTFSGGVFAILRGFYPLALYLFLFSGGVFFHFLYFLRSFSLAKRYESLSHNPST